MSSSLFVHLRERFTQSKPTSLNLEFLCRIGLVAVFAAVAHVFEWRWLRFVTSQAVLRVSLALGLSRVRVSFDTISGQATLFQFVTSCTFVDVFLGSIPLLWNRTQSLPSNFANLMVAVAVLFVFNVARLEVGQILYAHGVPWMLADDVLGGFAYFVVWIFIWRFRSWQVWAAASCR